MLGALYKMGAFGFAQFLHLHNSAKLWLTSTYSSTWTYCV